MRPHRLAVFVISLMPLGDSIACSNSAAEPAPPATPPNATGREIVLIKAVPHVKQKTDFCGEACLEMWLRKLGFKNLDQDHVFNLSGLNPIKARGCHTADMLRAMKRLGFKVGRCVATVPAAQAQTAMQSQWRFLLADLMEGIASIVCMRYDRKPDTTEHFRLILGYDAKTDEVIYHEPAVAGGAYRRMKRPRFIELWPLKYSRTRWTVIRIGLRPGRIVEAKPPTTFTSADYAQHVMALKKKIPVQGGFTVVIQPPFVVIGDEPPATVKRRAISTIRWAVASLKRAYFKKDPTAILDIWLFKNKSSYRKYTLEIFADRPDTPYGYYSDTDKALIMNIATGGGTLVHEIVHPFVAANFPACPAWLNEGLGSLYEQSAQRGGRIVGLTNWRLAGLQRAIRADEVPSFKALTSTTSKQFYRQDPGTNYSQARYLCYYLQQRGVLRKYYHAFVANHKKDPTGFETLKNVLGKSDMAAFKKEWQTYVMKLRFP